MTRIISFFILIILMAGTIWYVIYLSTAKETEIAQNEVRVEKVNTDIVDQEVLKKISELEANGNLPVTVSPEELGKTSPFTP